jgi:hypothetical protein
MKFFYFNVDTGILERFGPTGIDNIAVKASKFEQNREPTNIDQFIILFTTSAIAIIFIFMLDIKSPPLIGIAILIGLISSSKIANKSDSNK